MSKDKQLVRITMFVLLVGIVLVYAVFFNIHGDSLSASASTTLQKRMSGAADSDKDDERENETGEIAQVTGMQDMT